MHCRIGRLHLVHLSILLLLAACDGGERVAPDAAGELDAGALDAAVPSGTDAGADAGGPADASAPDAGIDASEPPSCLGVGERCRTVDQGCYWGNHCYWYSLYPVCGPPTRGCDPSAPACGEADQSCRPLDDESGICLTDDEAFCYCQGTPSRPAWCP
jgi:hypothetical protein